jgi:hypothetical protein
MRSILSILVALLLPLSGFSWGEKGHLMVNRLAIDAAGPQLPEFMVASRNTLIYNGYEPDRWREESNTPMNTAQAPDHFFDSELWGSIATIEKDRYAFMAKLAERKIDLPKIGYLPYAIVETYGRLRNAFRQWRQAKTAEDREAARANAVFYAGVMGHYVADGSQPLHMSIHYNGWADGSPNPRNYTKDRTLHGRYESGYVNRAIVEAQVKPRVRAPQRLPDVFVSTKQYLDVTFSELGPMYELEKTGEFNPEQPRAKGSEMISSQLARAATMLSNLWYTAWLESGEPVPATPRG